MSTSKHKNVSFKPSIISQLTSQFENECKINIKTTINPRSGKCDLMCPIKESSLRLNNKQYHKIFECDNNGKFTKYSLIKEYIRSSAGQEINLNHVRSGSTLKLTMQYLINITLNKTEISFIDRFGFLEDRIRAIIKDIYVQSLLNYDKLISIQLLEISVRFRIFSHIFLCHLDQQIQQKQQQTKSSPYASKMNYSKFLNMDLNEKPMENKYYYSSARNLCHLNNIFNQLFDLYKSLDFNSLSTKEQDDQIEIYCLAIFHKLVDGKCKNIINYVQSAKQIIYDKNTSKYIRKHPRIKIAVALINAYENLNKTLFFKIYHNKLTIIEKAVLYPILDYFRLCYIKKMCYRKCVRMPPWNLKYSFKSFVHSFGFHDSFKNMENKQCESADAMDFLSWYGGFAKEDIDRIVETGLSVDDFGKIKHVKGATRFPARDEFILKIDSGENEMQRIIQKGLFVEIDANDFYDMFRKDEQDGMSLTTHL